MVRRRARGWRKSGGHGSTALVLRRALSVLSARVALSALVVLSAPVLSGAVLGASRAAAVTTVPYGTVATSVAYRAASGRTADHNARPAPAAPPQPGQGWLTGRRQRLLAVWLLVDVGILLGLYGTGPVRPPRLLGSLGARVGGPADRNPVEAAAERRGIGRFAKPRTRPPSRL